MELLAVLGLGLVAGVGLTALFFRVRTPQVSAIPQPPVQEQDWDILHSGLLDYLPLRVYLKNSNLQYLACNESYAKSIGQGIIHIIGKTDAELFPPQLAEQYLREDRAVLSSETPVESEEQYYLDGKLRWVHSIRAPIRHQSGLVLGLVGLMQDITERKQAEIDRQLEDRRTRAILELNQTDYPTLQEIARRAALFAAELTSSRSALVLFAKDEPLIVEGMDAVQTRLVYGIDETGLPLADSLLARILRDGGCESEDLSQALEQARQFQKDDGYPIMRRIVAGAGLEEDFPFIVAAAGKADDYTEGGRLFMSLLANAILRWWRRHRLERIIRERERAFRSTFEQALVGMAHVSREGTFVRVNRRLCSMTGYTESWLLGKSWSNITHPEDIHRTELLRAGIFSGSTSFYSMEKRLLCKNGSELWVNVTGTIVRNDEGEPDYMLKVVEDIHLRREAEETVQRLYENLEERIRLRTSELEEAKKALEAANGQLTRLSLTDELTGLFNRRHLSETLEREWRTLQREKRPIAMLVLDIDHFKAYNDHYGHLQGDNALKAVAATIAGVVRRPRDLAARYGGEEFVILLPDTDQAGMERLARQVLDLMVAQKLPHAASSTEPFVTLSIGGAMRIPEVSQSPDSLFGAADQALYQAKAGGRNRAVFNKLRD